MDTKRYLTLETGINHLYYNSIREQWMKSPMYEFPFILFYLIFISFKEETVIGSYIVTAGPTLSAGEFHAHYGSLWSCQKKGYHLSTEKRARAAGMSCELFRQGV